MKILMTKEKMIYAGLKVILLSVYVMLSSCKTTKSGCEAYGENSLIRKDSLTLKVEHYHIDEEQY